MQPIVSIESRMRELKEQCEQFHVDKLFLFGSFLTNLVSDDSDIDMIVYFDYNSETSKWDYFENYMSLKENLEKLYDREVDLVEGQSIQNPIFRRSVDNRKKLIYERKSA